MAEFFAMGGYAPYVWSAYGVAAVILAGLLIASLRGLRACENTLKVLEDSRPRRRRAPRGAATTPATAEGNEA